MVGAFEAEVRESEAGPYVRHLGMTVLEVDIGRARLGLAMAQWLETFRLNGSMHGGAIASLIDAAASMALRTLRAPDEPPWVGSATADLNVSYLDAARSDLVAEARVLRAGRTVAFFQVGVRDADNKLVAVGRATMNIRRT